MTLIVFWIVLAIGFIGGAIYLVRRMEQRRSEAFERAAAESGLRFDARGDETGRPAIAHFKLSGQGPPFKMFGQEHRRKVRNTIVADG